MRFNLNVAATHPRWRLKCEFNTFFDGVLFVSGKVMYGDEYFVYLQGRGSSYGLLSVTTLLGSSKEKAPIDHRRLGEKRGTQC